MPPRKKKRPRAVQTVITIMVLSAVAGMLYVVALWWQSRQMQMVRYKEFGIPIPEQYAIHGIDVSRYQQLISWSSVQAMQVKKIKLRFTFIKATEGTGRSDPFFKRNWKKAKESGITRGAYHFFTPWKDGKTQAKNFIQTVQLESGDLPPVLDVEQLRGATPQQLRTGVLEWLKEVEAHYGVTPIIYTNADFYQRYLGAAFDDYPLWVAHYLQPHQPRIGRQWSFWQHSEQGRVNGILSKVDFNVFNGDSTDFQSLLLP
ncbi:MAG: glycoside hydrolase family 25 protein [Flavisolibacter sp.]|nr:glycoside hydrolase family 25 protein [Flavisolibacter sp.]MBD0353189.1 glycoside hydrolase family 25 protein [Flavisolibacter sp.]